MGIPRDDNPTWARLDPRIRMAVSALIAAAPGDVSVTSGWRSNEQQRQLHATKPGLAAKPGSSNHEFGLAVDLSFADASVRRWVHANAASFGLWFPMDYEPWHAQLIGVDRHNIGGGAQIGGGRFAFSDAPDARFVNPYDKLAMQLEQEDPYDPVTQFGRLVHSMSGGPDGGLLSSPNADALLSSPSMPSPTTEPEEMVGAMSGTADPTGALDKPED